MGQRKFEYFLDREGDVLSVKKGDGKAKAKNVDVKRSARQIYHNDITQAFYNPFLSKIIRFICLKVRN